MPFKSEDQRKFMFANHPEIAKRWTREEKMPESPVPKYMGRISKSELVSKRGGRSPDQRFGRLYERNITDAQPRSRKPDLQDQDRRKRDYSVAEDDWDLRRSSNTKEGQMLQRMQIEQATKHRLSRAAKRRLGQR